MWSYKNRHTLNILPQMRHWDLLGGMWKAKYGTFSSNRNTLKQRIKWTQIDTDTAVLSEYCTCGFDVDVMKNTDVDFTLFRRLLHGVAEECLTNLGKFLLFFQSLCELWGETAQIDNPHLYPFKTNFVWKYVFWCHFLRLVGMGSCGGSGCRRRATRLGSTSISRGQKQMMMFQFLVSQQLQRQNFPDKSQHWSQSAGSWRDIFCSLDPSRSTRFWIKIFIHNK